MFGRIAAAAALTAVLSVPALAMPVATLAPMDAGVTQVYAGCGPFGHRGPYGGCRLGGQAGGYVRGRACPRGWHLGAFGRRCNRNYFL